MKKIKHILLLLIMLLATALIGAATPTTSISGDNAKPTFANADDVSIYVGAVEAPADSVELRSSPSNSKLFERSTITTKQPEKTTITQALKSYASLTPSYPEKKNSAESTRKPQAFPKIE